MQLDGGELAYLLCITYVLYGVWCMYVERRVSMRRCFGFLYFLGWTRASTKRCRRRASRSETWCTSRPTAVPSRGSGDRTPTRRRVVTRVRFDLFHFVPTGFVSLRFVSIVFVSFRFDSFRFVASVDFHSICVSLVLSGFFFGGINSIGGFSFFFLL